MPALLDEIGKVVCVDASKKMNCPPFCACFLRCNRQGVVHSCEQENELPSLLCLLAQIKLSVSYVLFF